MFHTKIVLGVLAILPAFMLRAQPEPSSPSRAQPVAKAKSGGGDADKLLASWLMAGCNSEVAIARLGVQRAENAEVKQFAQKMVTAHTQLAAKLLPLAGKTETGSAAGVTKKESAGDEKGERESAEASSRRDPGGRDEFDHLALIRELNSRCLESQMQMLQAKTGADFDQSFMREQVGMHTQAVIMTEVFAGYASANLSATLKTATAQLREHLEQAKALCKKCESGEAIKQGSNQR